MQGKNRSFRHSRLSEAKFRLIMRYFTHDLPASKLAALSDVSCPTINQRFFKLRPIRNPGTAGKGLHGDVPDASKKPLQAVIRGQVALESIIHSDGWRGTMGWWIWVIRSISASIRNEFTRGNCHINGIESFWLYAKRRLAKFKGIPRHRFHLHLKECGFRFHHREENL